MKSCLAVFRTEYSTLRAARRWYSLAVFLVVAWLVAMVLDYVFGWQASVSGEIDRPFTNPLTVLAIVLSVYAVHNQSPLRGITRKEFVAWYLAVLIVALFPVSGNLMHAITGQTGMRPTGWNTASTIFLMAMSQMIRLRHRDTALILAALGLALPVLTLHGHILGYDTRDSDMSFLTSIALVSLAFANLQAFVRHRFIAALLRDTPTGRLLRMQLRIWLLVCLAVPLMHRYDRGVDFRLYPVVQTAENVVVLGTFLYFGYRMTSLLDRQIRTGKVLLSDLATDPLTGAATRKAAVDQFLRMNGIMPVGLILLDIDHFKLVNDTHGHAAGDRVLCDVVSLLQEELPISDIVARWGGEEFLVMVRSPDKAKLLAKAERLREALHRIPVVPGSTRHISASFGAVLVDPLMEPELADCVAVADQALYSAKRAGRDRVELASAKAENWSVLRRQANAA